MRQFLCTTAASGGALARAARVFAAVGASAALLAPAGTAAPDVRISVVVRATPATVSAVKSDAIRLGGRIERDLPVIDGFAAELPRHAVAPLRARAGVVSLTPDRALRLAGKPPGGSSTLGYDSLRDPGSPLNIAKTVRAIDSWNAGYTGQGIDIALIDSGVAPVEGLTSGNVVLGPDLSFESQDANVRNLDTFGHGTHMASIIAGRDAVGTAADYASGDRFTGMAPDARLVSIKVAAYDGATDVSQVIAAINWVVEHAHTDGLNIRVLNLSFGTDSAQDYRLDPLAYAAEVAMRKGIVVVAATGNDGRTDKTLADPAFDPAVLAAGAVDAHGTSSTDDDSIPTWATKGSPVRGADLVAPAVSVIGLRDPGSFIDINHPGGRLGTRFFRGSGTSQATAVVSGLAALLVQRYPTLSAAEIKAQLMAAAKPETLLAASSVGSGIVDVRAAQMARVQKATLPEYGTGTGLLELARGSAHVASRGANLVGEKDIMNTPWVGATWAPAALAGTTWTGGSWNGTTWTGSTWTSDEWFGTAWAGSTWTGTNWIGQTWTGTTWTGQTWTGTTWTGTWTGTIWTGTTWTNTFWGAAAWQ